MQPYFYIQQPYLDLSDINEVSVRQYKWKVEIFFIFLFTYLFLHELIGIYERFLLNPGHLSVSSKVTEFFFCVCVQISHLFPAQTLCNCHFIHLFPNNDKHCYSQNKNDSKIFPIEEGLFLKATLWEKNYCLRGNVEKYYDGPSFCSIILWFNYFCLIWSFFLTFFSFLSVFLLSNFNRNFCIKLRTKSSTKNCWPIHKIKQNRLF